MIDYMEENISEMERLMLSGSGVYRNEHASEDDLAQLQEYVLTEFGSDLPADYTSFLRISDGLQVENALFMGAADVAALNSDAPVESMFRIGEAGNLDDFLFDVRTRKFVIVPIGRPSEVHSAHDTFWELLKTVRDQQGVE